MGSWRKLLTFGLFTGFVATGCVITSSDDDDDDGAAGATSTGGTTAGGTGGTTSTGGSAGEAPTGGSAGAEPVGPCETCLNDNCSDPDNPLDFDNCNTDLCVFEFECVQTCILEELAASPDGFLTDDEKDACVTGCASEAQTIDPPIPGADGLVSDVMNGIYECINKNEWCAHHCYDEYEPVAAGGAGGAGGTGT